MRFTDEELTNIAAWTPIEPGFGRETSIIEANIRPILDRVSSDKRLALRIMQDGGLSNYFAFLVCDATALQPQRSEAQGVPCVVVKLSLMAAVGVFGQSIFSEGTRPYYFAHPGLEPDQVCDPNAPPDWISAAAAAAIHDTSPYRLVGREVTNQPLPPGVEIYEYCLCAEPWDRAFHALFADTD